MEKVISIGGVDVKLSNNVAWTMEYRDQFGQDILPVIIPLAEAIMETVASVISESGTDKLSMEGIAEAVQGRAIDIFVPMMQMSFEDLVINVLWSMAKAADEDIDPPKRWVRQFDTFPLDIIVPEVLDLVKTGFASSKNSARLETMIADVRASLQPEKK